jgi:hypothetical protein
MYQGKIECDTRRCLKAKVFLTFLLESNSINELRYIAGGSSTKPLSSEIVFSFVKNLTQLNPIPPHQLAKVNILENFDITVIYVDE